MRNSFCGILIGCVFTASGCGTIAGATPGPAPVPGQAIAAWLVEIDGRGGHHIHARNDSDRVQRITSVTLRECVNVEATCGTHRVDVLLCPGEAGRIFTVRPRVAHRGDRTFFKWSYGARAYEHGEPVIGSDCDPRGG